MTRPLDHAPSHVPEALPTIRFVASRYGWHEVTIPVDTRAEPSLSRHWLARRVGRVAHVGWLLLHAVKAMRGAWGRVEKAFRAEENVLR